MAARGGARIDWVTYGEARADLDRMVEHLEKRVRETEERIIKRLDDQGRATERAGDLQRADAVKLEDRVRALEAKLATLESQDLGKTLDAIRHEVTVLRTTNRLLAACGGAVVAVLGLAIAAVGLWR